MIDCFICKNQAESAEHIIPLWLQKVFNLQNQNLGLNNGNNISYKQAKYPLCKSCNNGFLSALENRIRKSQANSRDYYLWALKIRYMLSLKDSTMNWNVRNPKEGKMINDSVAQVGESFVRHALLSLTKEQFAFKPDPFGSVIVFNNPHDDNSFGFVDVPNPYWAIAISLPKRKILTVLFTDRGLVKKSLAEEFKSKGGFNGLARQLNMPNTTELVRSLMLKILLRQYQISNISYEASIYQNRIESKIIPKTVKYKKELRREVIIHIASMVNIPENIAIKLFDNLPGPYKK